jgi:hypothetical protein
MTFWKLGSQVPALFPPLQMGSKDIRYETLINDGHLKKEIRSLDPRFPILWPPENLRPKTRDRDFRLPTIFLICKLGH